VADELFLSRPGSANNSFATEAAGSALFLKLFSGEVLDAFDEYNVMYDLIEKRMLPRGSKSAQFLVTGRAAAAGLLPDASGNVSTIFNNASFINRIKSSEKEVFADGPIISATSIFEFDELRAQYDVRQGHAVELGRGVAEEFDMRGLLMVANGARSASLITVSGPDNDRAGTRVSDADFNSNGASAVATLFRLKRALDAKFVPQLDRHLVITPECYSNLAQQTDLLNRDWVAGSNGDFADGTVLKIAGFQLHISARLKSADNTSGLGNLSAANRAGCLNVYSGASAPNATNGGVAVTAGHYESIVGLAFHKSGVGAVDAMGMTMESDYIIEMQSTLMVAKKICGVSWLRPEACIEISDGTDA
jgi:hypothetical protein